nr:hypothetical protein [Chloroflexota bacterium]
LTPQVGRRGDRKKRIERASFAPLESIPDGTSAKEGVTHLRRARLGTPDTGNVDALTGVIIAAINRYISQYPATSKDQVYAALERLTFTEHTSPRHGLHISVITVADGNAISEIHFYLLPEGGAPPPYLQIAFSSANIAAGMCTPCAGEACTEEQA